MQHQGSPSARTDTVFVAIFQTVNGTDAVGGEFTLVVGSNASIPLAANASAAEVAEAVNSLKAWEGLVLVDRKEVVLEDTSREQEKPLGDLFEWRLTFSPTDGDVEELRVRSKVLPTYWRGYAVVEHINDAVGLCLKIDFNEAASFSALP